MSSMQKRHTLTVKVTFFVLAITMLSISTGCRSPRAIANASVSDSLANAIEASSDPLARNLAKATADDQADKRKKFIAKRGEDNFTAVMHLIEGNHDLAYAAANKAIESHRKEYQEVAYTIIALIERERNDPEREEMARKLIVKYSNRTETLYQAKIMINALETRLNTKRAKIAASSPK